MNSIGVKNFRSLEDTGMVSLKPLTMLLGKNSSGKSTFLRLIPLLKQTFDAKGQGALALFGDLVDFGSFSDVKYSNTDEDFIELRFSAKIPFISHLYYGYKLENTRDIPIVEVTFSLQIKPAIGNTDVLSVSSFEIVLFNTTIKCNIAKTSGCVEKFIINNLDYTNLLSDLCFKYTESCTFLPNLYVVDKNDNVEESLVPASVVTTRPLINYFKTFMGIRQQQHKIGEWAEMVPLCEYNNFKTALCNSPKIFKGMLHLHLQELQDDSPELIKLYHYYLVARLESILLSIESFIRNWAANSSYSLPLRASAERFYRSRPQIVESISADGANLVEYLAKLSFAQKMAMNLWLRNNFKIMISVDSQFGLQTLKLEEVGADGKSEVHNLADMGFGFSQVLPIIVQLWLIIQKGDKNNISSRYTYAIEQPELHLHPMLQAKLIKTFVDTIKVARKSGVYLTLIVETHSETIINYIGNLIEEKEISESDVNVVIFEKNTPRSPTTIKYSGYNEKGVLKNWPLGFFSMKEF